MANKRITDVDYIDSLNSNESFFVNQNNTIRQINKGDVVFEVVNGGTGANNVADARSNLGLGSVAVENTVPVTKGGTGAVNATVARSNLGLGDVATEDIVPVIKGGTGATDGATALASMFAAGNTILSANQYGDVLPASGVAGQIFFLKLT